MWCYQKPGFEVLLLAELQRQQQRSQFCDTLLKADGVSVPAHSCVLSAISPHVSTALSSTPAPPAGQSRLLEFHALGACTLLHMVRLLYSGEMAGEGEQEKQEAISAAASLGIHGLVEVTKRGHGSRKDGGGSHHMEVGVQTEPVIEENEGRRSTQTEELQVNTASLPPSAASFEATDVTALQNVVQVDSTVVHPEVPYISLVYPAENHLSQHPSDPAASMQNCAAAGETPVAIVSQPYTPVLPPVQNFSILCATDPKNWWVAPHAAARDVNDGEEFEQFQGDIPGFINYFLNPVEEASCRRRAGRRRRANTGSSRLATGERRTRRPRATTGGRGRGGLMQTVDVQDVGVSRLQKHFLQRWGSRVSGTGQGGGAVGRKLDLKSREILKKSESSQKRRRRGKMCELSESGLALPHMHQFKQASAPVAGRERAKAKATIFPPTPMQISSAPLHPSLCPMLLSPAAQYMPPASSLLHTTCLPSPAPLPQVDQPEQIDRLLEEVMMGLDILPKNNNGAPQHPPLPRSSSVTYASSGNDVSQNKQHGCTAGLPRAGPCFSGSTHVAVVASGAKSSTSAQGEVPALQQQGEGELNVMLDHFLQSFEQHIDNCSAREVQEFDDESSTEPSTTSSVLEKHGKTKAQTKTSQSSRPQNTQTHCQTSALQQSNEADAPSVHSQPLEASTENSKAIVKRVHRRRTKQYVLSLEKKQTKVKKPAPTSGSKTNMLHNLRDKQLQQMPVVRLEKSSSLSFTATLQTPSKRSEKHPCSGGSFVKNQPLFWTTKSYPLRSRFRDAQIMDSLPFLHDPLEMKQPHSAGQADSRQLLTSPVVESSLPSVHPHKNAENEERFEVDLTAEPQEEAEAAPGRGMKRSAETEEETSDNAAAEAKKLCSESVSGCDSVSEQETTDAEEVIDVETLSLTSAGGCLKDKEQCEKTAKIEINLKESEESLMGDQTESSGDEIIDVERDTGGPADGGREQVEKVRCQYRIISHFAAPASQPPKEGSAGCRESGENEDIDVIGASSPPPCPEQAIISWMEASGGEDETKDVDIVLS